MTAENKLSGQIVEIDEVRKKLSDFSRTLEDIERQCNAVRRHLYEFEQDKNMLRVFKLMLMCNRDEMEFPSCGGCPAELESFCKSIKYKINGIPSDFNILKSHVKNIAWKLKEKDGVLL